MVKRQTREISSENSNCVSKSSILYGKSTIHGIENKNTIMEIFTFNNLFKREIKPEVFEQKG